MKLTLLALQQAVFLALGISMVTSVSHNFESDIWWLRIIVGAIGLTFLLGGLATRDRIREETAMARRLATLKKQTENMEVDQ